MGRRPTFRSIQTLAALALTTSLYAGQAAASDSHLPAFTMPAERSAHVSQDKSGVLIRQDATLTVANRANGMPATADPGRQLQGAKIGIETYGQDTPEPSYFLDISVTLAGTPGSDPDALLNVGFGNQSGTACQLNAVVRARTSDYDGREYHLIGYNPEYFPTPPNPWDCVAVFLDDAISGPPTTTYDAMVAPLTDTRESARLEVEAVTLLGRKQKSLKLVRGSSTQIGIELKNTGKVRTGKLTLRGSGKGIKVSRGTSDPIGDGSTSSATLKVKLTGSRKRTKVKLRIGDGKVSATRTLGVVRVNPPKRPRAGSYRSSSGDVRFSIRRGRIVGWNGTMTTRCGGFPDNFTYTTNTYDFPRTKVPRNGIVQESSKGDLYSAFLRLRIAGSKVTQGLFTYYGPDRCFASVPFTAKRTGS